jgi:hypothetical protein
MARRSRHARSNTWFALKAAYAQAVQELAAERSARFADQLNISRLTGLADELEAQLDRTTHELAVVRRELQVAREMGTRPDPNTQALALEATELRATIAEQQRALAHLTSRLLDLLDRSLPPSSPTPPSRPEPVAIPEVPARMPSPPDRGRSPAPVGRGTRVAPPSVDAGSGDPGEVWLRLAEQTTDA